MPIERKLAAIMFTDIAGYTAQMSKDEAVAISLLNKKESVLKPLIKKHNGTYVKSTGDGSLSHFNSAVDAATCAKRFQESIYDDKDLNVRVGVHLGDTIFKKGDIRGDGVNIASRLESMAVEGGVFISKEVHDQLVNQKEFEGVSLGLQSMKGVGRVIEVFGLKGDKLSEPNPTEYQDDKIDKHSDDEVPSIAIIPFENKGKEEDAFYAYGISADLITDCSSAGLIRVASLERLEKIENYDKLDIIELASKLSVRYIAQGTLWKMDNMFQLSIELYDTKESKVIWSDRWEENWDNLPTIKGSLSDGLLKALDTKPKVEQKAGTTNTEAYELYLKAKYKYEKRENSEDTEIVLKILKKVIELDNDLIFAKNLLGRIYEQKGDFDMAMEIYQAAIKQVRLIDDKPGMRDCLTNIGIAYQQRSIRQKTESDLDIALDFHKKALVLASEIGNINGKSTNLGNIGTIYTIRGNLDKALGYLQKSLEIDKKTGSKLGLMASIGNIGIIYSRKGDYDKALEYYNEVLPIQEDISNKRGMGISFLNIGNIYEIKGKYDIALDYYKKSLKIRVDIGEKPSLANILCNIGGLYFLLSNYKESVKYLEKSIYIQKDIGINHLELYSTSLFYLNYKHLGRQYDEKEIQNLINKDKNIEYELNLRLYELLEDTSYIKTAYNQVQEKADNLEPDVAGKFLSYPIPKAIVEEWEKVK